MSMPPPPPPPPSAPGPPPGFQAYPTHQSATPAYAGFGARLGAFIIDGLIGAVFNVPAIVALFAGPRKIDTCTINGEVGLCEMPTGTTWALVVLLGLAGTIGYMVLYCKKVSAGQSWGHKAAGVRIIDANTGSSISAGRVFGRQIARIPSAFVCYLGYLWMLWDPKKQTWHDKILNTIVVKA